MPTSKIGPIFLSLALLIGVTAACISTINLWQPDGYTVIGGARQLLIPAAILFLLGTILVKFQFTSQTIRPGVFVTGLFIVFFSNWLFNPYGLLPAPSSRGLIILFGLIVGSVYYFKKQLNWSLIALICLSLMIWNFLGEANGRLITSDDHATFLHRLLLLRDNFFNIPIYDPFWNSGYDQRYFFATGAINFFLLTLPLSWFFPLSEVYNFCFLTVAIILPFISVYFAARLLKLSVNASWLAALLALAPCAEWFRWTFQYGTMGFVVSSGLIPINLALSIKILDTKENFSFWQAILLIISFSLMLFWSMSGMVFIPLIIWGIFKIFSARLIRKNYVGFVLASLLLINLPWIMTFWSVSKVGNFLKSEHQIAAPQNAFNEKDAPVSADYRYKHKTGSFQPSQSLKLLREFASSCNPLLLFLTIPGLFLLERRYRNKFLVILLWLIGFATIFVQIKPQLELDRFLVMCSLLATIPTALALEKIFSLENYTKKVISILSIGIVGGFLLAAPISVNSIINRNSLITYNFQGDLTKELITALQNYQDKGRVLFSGMIMHEIDGGHLAAIPELSGTPVIASTFIHNLWTYKQVFPEDVIAQKDQLIPEYLRLNNVIAVLAHDPIWIKYFRDHPDTYQYQRKAGRFYIFNFLKHSNSYFEYGDGEIIDQTNHSVVIKLKSPTATIKFRYFPFLETNSSCKISPKKFIGNLELIHLEDCPTNQEIILKSKPAWQRISF